MNAADPVTLFSDFTHEFERGRIPATKQNMVKAIVLGGLALARAGQVSNRVGAEAQRAIGALLAQIRQAEGDLRAGRQDEALAALQRMLNDADRNVFTGKPAGSA